MQLKALLLDLDGTLVDTAPDMVGTLNRVLKRHGEPSVSLHDAGKLVSNGARALLDFGFAQPIPEETMPRLVDEFLSDYAAHVADQSRLYEGMPECLAFCEAQDIPWGVVTNKPLNLSRDLLDGLGYLDSCRILLGGDSLPVKKPDPAPLLHCCMTLSLAASECLYVGDHERDIQAGRNAGMDTAVALWGYIHDQQSPQEWQANYLVRQPTGLLDLLIERVVPNSAVS